ncbi:hypothetical protein K435DRAFT_863817 [Dendrothele bispora CBS 962.96]|uniref:Uncharacterized protein n=1 Tax=Dendrothele bispora (strain CBS 962.96) TaxID=1314807 RepID=A0A4S8LPS4_DENBC|nr:hypothetical protein K435DRAFT_863817 [Dendrothele bispora CBS 962.96]
MTIVFAVVTMLVALVHVGFVNVALAVVIVFAVMTVLVFSIIGVVDLGNVTLLDGEGWSDPEAQENPCPTPDTSNRDKSLSEMHSHEYRVGIVSW